MKQRNLLIVLKLILTIYLFLTSLLIHANYWQEEICTHEINEYPSNLIPGESFDVLTSITAQRTADSSIPIHFYYSSTTNINSGSQYLGSNNATVYFPGPHCSRKISTTLTLPQTTPGLNCFIESGYIIAQTGTATKAEEFQAISTAAPEISFYEFSPTSGHVGSIVHIKGKLFNNDTTAVYIGGVPAVRTVIKNYNGTGDDEIMAIVPKGATSGFINVEDVSAMRICNQFLVQSTEMFTVTPNPLYCNSGAANTNYGRISYVESKDFVHNEIASLNCLSYTDNSSMFTTTSVGLVAERFYVQFNSCGQLNYPKLFKVYVDWNNDQDFDDPAEFVLNAPNVNSDMLYSLDIPVPSFANIGTIRLRIINALYYTGIVDNSDDVQACGYYPFGETQDYVLDITMQNGALQANISEKDISNKINLINEPQSIKMTNNQNYGINKDNFIDKKMNMVADYQFTYPKGQKHE